VDDDLSRRWGPKDPGDQSGAVWELVKTARGHRQHGDFRAAVEAIDEALLLASSDEGFESSKRVFLLLQKAVWLSLAERFDDGLVTCAAAIDLAEEQGLALLQAQARVAFGIILGDAGRSQVALEAFTEAADSVVDESDPELRAVAARARASRIGQLVKVGRTPDALREWNEVLGSFGEDSDIRVRIETLYGCEDAVVALSQTKNYKAATGLADDLVDRFRASDVPEIRGCVAVTMANRLYALKKRRRPVAAVRASGECLAFIGAHPEPEVVEAMRSRVKGGDSLLRQAERAYR
jgi:tetratricopeptide (TPR) repeat protein